MTEDLSKKKPQDASKIDVHEPWELLYWCKKLGVSEVRLKAAVKAVGVSVAAVKKHLSK